jgi:hypothetical protein
MPCLFRFADQQSKPQEEIPSSGTEFNGHLATITSQGRNEHIDLALLAGRSNGEQVLRPGDMIRIAPVNRDGPLTQSHNGK